MKIYTVDYDRDGNERNEFVGVYSTLDKAKKRG